MTGQGDLRRVAGRGHRSRSPLGLAGLVMVPSLLLSCSDPTEPEVTCFTAENSGCWAFLGLEDEWISEVAATPWGVFVGTADSGIFRLEADGAWTQLGPEGWHDRMIPQALLYVPADPPRLLAGLRWRHDSNDTTRAAVYASFDRGDSWIPFDGGLAETAPAPWQYRVFVDDLEVDPGDPRRVFMSTCHGVLESADAGQSWMFMPAVDRGFNVCLWFVDVLIDSAHSGRLWVGGESNVFTPFVSGTPDWGLTWYSDSLLCDGTIFETSVNSLALAPDVPNRLFAGADAALYRSDDAGRPGSWDCVPGTRGAVIDLEELDGALYAATATVEYTTDPDGNPAELAELGLFRTPDGGSSWQELSVPEGADGATEMAADPEGNRLLIGTRSGIWAFTP